MDIAVCPSMPKRWVDSKEAKEGGGWVISCEGPMLAAAITWPHCHGLGVERRSLALTGEILKLVPNPLPVFEILNSADEGEPLNLASRLLLYEPLLAQMAGIPFGAIPPHLAQQLAAQHHQQLAAAGAQQGMSGRSLTPQPPHGQAAHAQGPQQQQQQQAQAQAPPAADVSALKFSLDSLSTEQAFDLLKQMKVCVRGCACACACVRACVRA